MIETDMPSHRTLLRVRQWGDYDICVYDPAAHKNSPYKITKMLDTFAYSAEFWHLDCSERGVATPQLRCC